MKILIIVVVVIATLAISFLATTGLVWLAIKGYELGFSTSVHVNVWGISILVWVVLLLFGSRAK